MGDALTSAVKRIRRVTGEKVPSIALVLGSGFESVTSVMQVDASIPYSKLPGFPVPKVPGHRGELLLARVERVPFLVCCGRAHYYEGTSMTEVMFPTRALAEAGVRTLLLTNAAGGINADLAPGDFMLFSDHINFTGTNPLRGLPAADGRCFVSMTDAYSPRLAQQFRSAARKIRVKLHRGVYLCVSGPSYETPAEIRAFRKLGADAVGMSTVPEVLMARYCGVEVAALSCITNYAAGLTSRPLSHKEVLAVGRESARRFGRLLHAFACELGAAENSAPRKDAD